MITVDEQINVEIYNQSKTLIGLLRKKYEVANLTKEEDTLLFELNMFLGGHDNNQFNNQNEQDVMTHDDKEK